MWKWQLLQHKQTLCLYEHFRSSIFIITNHSITYLNLLLINDWYNFRLLCVGVCLSSTISICELLNVTFTNRSSWTRTNHTAIWRHHSSQLLIMSEQKRKTKRMFIDEYKMHELCADLKCSSLLLYIINGTHLEWGMLFTKDIYLSHGTNIRFKLFFMTQRKNSICVSKAWEQRTIDDTMGQCHIDTYKLLINIWTQMIERLLQTTE